MSNINIAESISSLFREYHAFYQVSPYYVELDERPVGLPTKTQRVQAGFEVDVYGVRTEDNEPAMPPPHEYELGYTELQNIAERVSQHSTDCCSLEVIPFPNVAIIDREGKVEAIIRIRISHWRGLDQPAGPAEQRALEEIEEELSGLGIARR